VTESVEVELARVADRDRVLQLLHERGLDASEVEVKGRVALEIACGEDARLRGCDDVVHELEALVAEAGIPLVPLEDEGRVFLRPPAA
jgi:hypothetical protein